MSNARSTTTLNLPTVSPRSSSAKEPFCNNYPRSLPQYLSKKSTLPISKKCHHCQKHPLLQSIITSNLRITNNRESDCKIWQKKWKLKRLSLFSNYRKVRFMSRRAIRYRLSSKILFRRKCQNNNPSKWFISGHPTLLSQKTKTKFC